MSKRAFQLFVSSTFQDFAREREVLQSRVFPALEAHCAAEDFGFRAIDMRWGVTAEAQLDHRTAEICLEAVTSARGHPAPNLLILVGDRPGWIPLPHAIALDEFEAIDEWLQVVHPRGEADELRRVYALDENQLVQRGLTGGSAESVLTAAYVLRSREDDLVDLKDPDAWEATETSLRTLLQAAAKHLHRRGRLSDAGCQKYFTPLTEQEILRGLDSVPRQGDASRALHTLAWIRKPPEERATSSTVDGENTTQALAEGLKWALPDESVIVADAAWSPDGDLDAAYIASFAETITNRLRAQIDAHIAAVKSQELADTAALMTERAAHQAFASERTRVFVGREKNRRAITDYLGDDRAHPLVVYGPSGAGKSALVARAVADAKETVGGPIVFRFVGASAASSDQRALLVSLIEDLAEKNVADVPAKWEQDPNRFVTQVRDILAAVDQPVAIFIDALDQLRKPYRSAWLPTDLHPKVKLVLSVLDDAAFAEDHRVFLDLRRRLPPKALLAIEPLNKGDGEAILSALLAEAGRTLQPDQKALVLQRYLCVGGSPLYLRVAFEIVRHWRSTGMAADLADSVTSLMGQFIDELSNAHHHDELLVERTLGFLIAAREGLNESEVVAALSRDAEVMNAISSEQHGARTTRLPDSVWVRLRRHLSDLLVERQIDGQPLLQFFHRQVIEVVRERIYQTNKRELHQALAAYFDTPVATHALVLGGEAQFSRRSLVELPHQMFHANERDGLDELLTSPAWIEQKFRAIGTQALIQDYRHFSNPQQEIQSRIGRTLRLASGIVERDPTQLMSQLHGRLLTEGGAAQEFLDALFERIPPGALIEKRLALSPAHAEVARLDGHGSTVYALALLRDGRLASGSNDRTIRLWDIEAGQEIARLEGHESAVTALAILPDGRLASGSYDRTIRIWDIETGQEISRFRGNNRVVSALTALQDGRLASGTGRFSGIDSAVHLWNIQTGEEVARLEGREGNISALALLPNGHLASALKVPNPDIGDQVIHIWDAARGAEVNCLEVHSGEAISLAALPDGRLASGTAAGNICIFDLATGNKTIPPIANNAPVRALAVLPNGMLATGSDESIRIWNVSSDVEPGHPPEHDGPVSAMIALPGGCLVTGSWRDEIRFWDIATGERTVRFQSEGILAEAFALLPDGHLATGWGRTIHVWDISTGDETARLESQCVDNSHVRALAALPNGYLANTFEVPNPITRDRVIHIWDVATGAEVNRLEERSGEAISLAALPDGRLASGADLGRICLWDVFSGAETACLEGHQNMVTALAVLPDGRLVSGSYDKSVRVWDTAAGREICCLEGHNEGITALAILSNRRIATSSFDRTVRIWDVSTGQETARLQGDGVFRVLAPLPDGGIAAGDSFGRVHWLAIKR